MHVNRYYTVSKRRIKVILFQKCIEKLQENVQLRARTHDTYTQKTPT